MAPVHSLPIFLRLADAPVILVGDGPMADAKARAIERAGGEIVGEEREARVAFVAGVADPGPVAARLKARGLLVNVADRPDLSDFTMPAIVDRAPVIVAVGTGGASAGLSAALRQRLETMLPASLGRLAESLYAARPALADRLPDMADRRRALSAMMAADGPLDPLREIAAPDPVAALDATPPARIERITLASPDPDELTIRAARLLAVTDRLYLAPDIPAAIAARARADAERIVGPAPALPLPGLSVELVWKAA